AAERLSRDGRKLLTQGDRKAATAHFKRAVQEGSDEAHGRLGLALVAIVEGRTPDAQEQIVALRAKGIEPADTAPWLTALLDSRKHIPPPIPDADEPEDEADVPPPKPVRQKAELTDREKGLSALFQSGNYSEVIKQTETAENQTLFELKLVADGHYNLQNWTRAVPAYRRVLRDEPGNEPVTQYLADALYRLKRYDEAIAFYRVLAENNPERPGFWRLIGDTATAKGDDEVALAAYLRALQGGYDDQNVNTAVEDLKARLAPDEKATSKPR
ncbi:MAG: tetratricopeptide (TPR) repeat protein, partial [Myxococcota bacterium]